MKIKIESKRIIINNAQTNNKKLKWNLNLMRDKVKPNSKWIFITVMLLAPLSQMNIDYYSVIMPAILNDISHSLQHFTLITSSYLAAYAIGQVIQGYIVDSLGAKKALSIMFPIYIISTFFTPFLPNLSFFICMRAIQGITISGISVIVKFICANTYKEKELSKVMSYLAFIWGISPILSPSIGAVITQYLSWQWCFYILAILSLFTYYLATVVLSDYTSMSTPLSPKKMLSSYKKVLSSRLFWHYCFQINVAVVSLLGFITQTPHSLQTLFHISILDNGYIALLAAFFFLIGTQSADLIENKIRSYSWVILSSLILFVIISVFIISFYDVSLFTFISLSLPLMTISGLLFPKNISRCIQLFPEISGIASGLMSFFTLFIPSTLFILTSQISSNLLLIYPVSLCMATLMALFSVNTIHRDLIHHV